MLAPGKVRTGIRRHHRQVEQNSHYLLLKIGTQCTKTFSKLPQIMQVSAREVPRAAAQHSLLKLPSNVIEDKQRHEKRDKLIDPPSCIDKQEKSIPASKEKERTFPAHQRKGERVISWRMAPGSFSRSASHPGKH